MEFEVEQIVDKRFNRGKIQYRVKWLNYDRRYNRWINIDDLSCDELIERFEKSHKIVGSKKSAGVVSYNVHKNGKHAELISSSAAKEKWPGQVFVYLQNSIKMVTEPDSNNDIHQNPGEIDILKVECAENVDNLVGHPIKVCYVTDIRDEWYYLVEWSDGKYQYISGTNMKRWCRLVFDYLEAKAI